MAQHNAVPGFRASVNGLHFTNSWPSEPDIIVDVSPLGKVPIGDASNGLCGGMVYTVMDVFGAALPPIPDTTNPAQGTPMFNYLVSRLFASFDIPGGVLKYFDWMNTPDHDTGVWIFTRRGVAWHTIMEEWPRVKADIDVGMLSPLGLVTVYTTDPTMMGHNHQVLAYAYDVDDSNVLTLHLYDPNTPPTGADDVQLTIDLSNPAHTSPISHNVITGAIRGFFRTTYAFSNPASLEPTTPLPSNAFFVSGGIASPLSPGAVTSTTLTFENIGGTTWTAAGANPFRLGAQNPQDNTTWGTNRVELPHDVAPGEQVSFAMQITAPTAPGTYHFAWRMVQEGVTWFGDTSPDVPVVVPTPQLPGITVTVTPALIPMRRAVMVTVHAVDAVTGATLTGTVTVNGAQIGTTDTPFSLTVPAHRVLTPDGLEWEAVLPTGTVSVPGHALGTIPFDAI